MKGFSQNISQLMLRINMQSLQGAILNFLSNNMIIDLNVFHSLMKQRISSYVKCCLAGVRWETCRSFSNENNHIISQVAFAIALYSTSAKKREIVEYFLDFHDTNEYPRKT